MNVPLFTVTAVAVYALVMLTLAHFTSGRQDGQEGYHVAGRNVGGIIGALSVASTWVWAPALFTSASQAYSNGVVGVGWFIIPNALSLIVMLPFAMAIRRRYPGGFTLSGFMRRRYGAGTQRLYITTMGGLAVLSVSVNLLAGGTVLSMLTGIPLILCSTAMLLLVGAYTFRYGVRASLSTDVAQISMILVVLAVLIPSTIHLTGWDVVAAGAHGVNGVADFFGADGRMVALTFGIISAIGLAAGPIGDQAFWQRAFAMRRGEVVTAFGLGAVFFTLVPVMMSFLGFTAAGAGFTPDDAGYVNLEYLTTIFPVWVTVPFMLMIVSALFSIVNSHLLAQASLASDLTGDIRVQRWVMGAGAVVSLAVANVPGNSVTTMFLLYSTLRSSTFLITALTLGGVRLAHRPVFWGITTALTVGFGGAVWANLVSGAWEWRLAAILFTTLAPVLIAGVGTLATRVLAPARAEMALADREPDYVTPAEVTARREAVAA